MSESPSITDKHNNTIHNSRQMTPMEASKELNGKLVCFELQDKRQKLKLKCELGVLVKTADTK